MATTTKIPAKVEIKIGKISPKERKLRRELDQHRRREHGLIVGILPSCMTCIAGYVAISRVPTI